MIAALILQAAVAPQPGVLRTFADWTVGCDNARVCEAVALGPQNGASEGYLMLRLRREGDARAAAALSLPIPTAVKEGTRLSLAVDGKTLLQVQAPGGGSGMALPFAGAIGKALSAGHEVTLAEPGGRVLARASLAGLSAATLYMEEAQQRAGKHGNAPPIPALPRIVQPPAGNAPPRTLSVKDATKLIGPDNAHCAPPYRNVAPRAFRLDAAHTLVTIEHPCGNGAYNVYTSVYVLEAKGKPVPARFDAPSSLADGMVNRVVNGGWDAARRRMTSFGRGRGIGDCGRMQEFAWDGAMFRLALERAMGECRGVTDYVTVWRAEVAGR
jgi:hypothetical protein